jgi:hypothetical protein
MTHPNSVIVDDRRDGDRILVAETPIPRLGRHEVDELYSAIVGAAMAAGVCVLAGTKHYLAHIGNQVRETRPASERVLATCGNAG